MLGVFCSRVVYRRSFFVDAENIELALSIAIQTWALGAHWVRVLSTSPRAVIRLWINQPLGGSVSHLENGVLRAANGSVIRNKWVNICKALNTVLAKLQLYLLMIQLVLAPAPQYQVTK